MPLQSSDKEHPKGPEKERDADGSKSGQEQNPSDKKLLLGTVQFYEDILDSMQNTFVAVINEQGKVIEVWGNAGLKSLYGLNPLEFKGKLIDDLFQESVAFRLKNSIHQIFQTGSSQSVKARYHFPKGEFWIEANMSPLAKSSEPSKTVVAYFHNVTDAVQKEHELEIHREKYKNYIEHIPEGIVFVNHKGIITSVNQALQNISGYRSDSFIGFKLTRIPFLDAEDVPRFQALVDSIYDGLHPVSFEFKWQNAAGLKVWTEVQTSFITRGGKVTGAQIIFTDITERKLIERDLLKSKQAYKVIIENAHEAIFILQENHIRFCNSRLLDLVGYSMDHLPKIDFDHLVYVKDRENVKEFLGESFTGKSNREDFSFRFVDINGAIRWVNSKAVLVDWDNKPAMLLFANDVTDQKIAVAKEKQQLKSIEFISEKAIEFGELTGDYNVFQFIGEKIDEVTDSVAILVVSYDSLLNRSNIEHIEGSPETIEQLNGIIESNFGEFSKKFNYELIRNLSYGTLLKYNDGLFEYGYNVFPKITFNLIQESLDVGDIYLIGLTFENEVYGTVMLFLPEGRSIDNQEAIEIIVKLGSVALHRKSSWDNLRIKTEKYHTIFESYQDVYFKVDIDGILSEISPSVLLIGGYKPADIIGEPITGFFPDISKLKSVARELIRHESITDRDIKLIRKDGTIAHASLNARLLRNKKGIPIGSEGFLRDITERKKMEEKFLKSEMMFRTMSNFTYDWEYWIAPDGEMVYTSPSCERVTGFTPEEFVKDPGLSLKITHEEDHQKFKHHIEYEELNNKDKVLVFDYRIRTKNNEVKWISHLCREVYDEFGNTLGRRVSNRDITDQKLAEIELRNSEERFKALFLESPDAVFVEDETGIVLDVNPAACSLLKMKKNELAGKHIIDLLKPENKEITAGEFTDWMTSHLTNFRGVARSSENEEIPVEINASEISYSGHKAFLFIVRNITEIIKKEERLRQSAEKAEEADMLKSAFLANVSHEIRTPMNAIIGFSEILTNQDLSPKEREEFINYITQGSNTLMNLIEDIIDITKIEAGQIKINFSDCNVDKLLDELYATFLKMKNKNGRSNVELRMNKPMMNEDFVISTDPHRIRQIMSNLLGNAIKFTEEGFIEFGFQLSPERNIQFYVKDSGIGIPEDKQTLIFERFGQVDDTRNEHKGTGLGLSISRKLAELLGGILSVETALGEGSKFMLTLPLDKDYMDQIPTVEKLPSSKYDWHDKTFLIAEDSILNYTFLEALFQKTKVKLLWAKDGREAIELCRKNDDIDIVLMDIKMPVIDGLEAIAEIKKFKKDLPIIVQTAYAMPEDRDKTFAAGGDDHLTKPINPEELFNTISKYMN
jgi:PAS domain S-box-containing protein